MAVYVPSKKGIKKDEKMIVIPYIVLGIPVTIFVVCILLKAFVWACYFLENL